MAEKSSLKTNRLTTEDTECTEKPIYKDNYLCDLCVLCGKRQEKV